MGRERDRENQMGKKGVRVSRCVGCLVLVV
jgi:hypothetical protein